MIQSGSSKILQLLRNPIEEKVPKGWFTIPQLAERTGMGAARIGAFLKKEKPPCKFFRVKMTNGYNRPVCHYYYDLDTPKSIATKRKAK
jgi:hypothetical protein